MLVINPTNASIAACASRSARPKLSFADTQPGLRSWLKLYAEYASVWANTAIKRPEPADAKAFDGVAGKLQYFSASPGQGD